MLLKKRTIVGLTLCIIILTTTVPVIVGIKNAPVSMFTGDDVVIITNSAGKSPVSADLASKLRSLEFVDAVSPEIYALCVIKNEPVFLRGVEAEHFLRVEGVKLKNGDVTGAIIGEGLADRLNLKVGRDITLTGSTTSAILELTVTGVYSSESLTDDEIAIPISQARALTTIPEGKVSAIRVKTSDREALTEYLEDRMFGVSISDNTGQTIKTDGNKTTTKEIGETLILKYSKSEFKEKELNINTFVQKGTGSVSLVTFSFIVLSALLTTIGITAILARSVFDRRKDIGIISAIGASRMKIRTILLKEFLIIALPSSFLGIVFSFFFTEMITSMNILMAFGHSIKVNFDLSLTIGMFVSTVLISCISGLICTELILRTAPTKSIREIEEESDEGFKNLTSVLEV